MTIPPILYLPLAIGLFLIFLYFMARMFGGACGGREVCGRRFCPMGFLEDHKVLFAGLGVGFLICSAVLLIAVSPIPVPYPGMDSLPSLPSQTAILDGTTITIAGQWSGCGHWVEYLVTCEGERCYNATIYQCNFKDDPSGVVLSQAPWNRVLTTINKTGSSATALFWPMDHGIYYPLVVLDDGTYVQFCEIRGDDL